MRLPGGSHLRYGRFVSLLSREAADELGLEPGMLVAAVEATSVSVDPHKRTGTSINVTENPPRHRIRRLSFDSRQGNDCLGPRRSATKAAEDRYVD